MDERFAWLQQEFGSRPLGKRVVLPTPEDFPETYAPNRQGAEVLFTRVCRYMDVDRDRIDLQFYQTAAADGMAASFNPALHSGYALGTFQDYQDRVVITLETTRLDEPMQLVSTMAHELAHVHLLADGRLTADHPDHESLTDLLALYLGMGVFMANATIHESHWRAGNMSGWAVGKRGYLSLPEFAYALALYTQARGEGNPKWIRHLRPDVRALFKSELKELERAFREFPRYGQTERSIETDELDADEISSGEGADDRVEIASDEEPHVLPRGSADAHFTRGVACRVAGELEAAEDAFSAAVALTPRDAEAWYERGEVRLQRGKFAAAADDFNNALRLDSTFWEARRGRGHSLVWLGRYAEAIDDCNRVLHLECHDARLVQPRSCPFWPQEAANGAVQFEQS